MLVILYIIFVVYIVDETRVRLKGDPDVEGSDYINASFIDVSTATTVREKKCVTSFNFYRDTPTKTMPT